MQQRTLPGASARRNLQCVTTSISNDYKDVGRCASWMKIVVPRVTEKHCREGYIMVGCI